MLKQVYKSIFKERTRISILQKIKQYRWYFNYKGNKFSCNVCRKSSSKFLSKNNRKNAECPYCGSLERHRLIWHKLQNILSSGRLSILHFAPFMGIQQQLVNYPGVHYVDVDINPNMARHVEDIRQLSFENKQFDIVICSHVLAHVDDEKQALSEIIRVLKPNGKAWILTGIHENNPNSQIIGASNPRHFGESGRKNEKLYKLHGKGYKDELIADGFKLEEMKDSEYPLAASDLFLELRP